MNLSKRYQPPSGSRYNLGEPRIEPAPKIEFDDSFRVPVVFWLWNATRRCQLACRYCRIARPDFPEVDWATMVEIIGRFQVVTDNALCVAMGGEITILPYVDLFIAFARDIDLSYAFLSNAVSVNQEKMERWVRARGLKNWSVSVDGFEEEQTFIDEATLRKSSRGFNSLLAMGDLGVPDLHAAVVVTRKNVRSISSIIRSLSDFGIWTEPLCVEFSKSEWYDYAPTKEELKGVAFEPEDIPLLESCTREWITLLETPGILLHSTKSYLQEFPRQASIQDWRDCVPEACPSVDSDGYMRLCQRIGGFECRKIHAFEFATKDGYERFKIAAKKDKAEFCQGCFWDCGFTSAEFARGDVKDGQAKFKHEKPWSTALPPGEHPGAIEGHRP